MKREQINHLLDLVNNKPAMVDYIRSLGLSGDWGKYSDQFVNFLNDGTPRFTIISEGNSKLPFLAFSGLALYSCPGAGDCREWCYSLKSWRYPAALFRQIQNHVLMRTKKGRGHILQAIDAQLERPKFRDAKTVNFRLYVDGDFANLTQVKFWMDAIKNRPMLSAYGYSKSWREFLKLEKTGYQWPENYKLNLSSGSVHRASTKEAIKALPITRGEFKTVAIANRYKNSEMKTRQYRNEVLEAFGSKTFVCPGKCGSCTKDGPACGSNHKSLKNVPIVIGLH